jgi:hypothetical protein
LIVPVKPVPVPVAVTAKVPAVAEARSVPETEAWKRNTEGVSCGLVSTLTAPEALNAADSSVAAPKFVVLISASAYVVPVGV